MAKIELKVPIIEEIKQLIDGAKGSVLVDYRGLLLLKIQFSENN